MTEKQLTLDLGDEMQIADALYQKVKREHCCYSSTSMELYPSRTWNNHTNRSEITNYYWIGVRTGGYETEHNSYERVTEAQADFLSEKYDIPLR